jgi:outer membrane lipoprotein-sorting protein
MIKKIFASLLIVLFTAIISDAADLSLDDLVNKIKANQDKIKDLYAETITVISSNMSLPGQEGKGPQKMVQKGKMWTKGEDKSKLEVFSPTHQITITNGDQMVMINPDTGQKMVQDLKKLKGETASSKGQGGMGQMSLAKTKEYFNLSVVSRADTGKTVYLVTGVPKKENKIIGKIEFYVDSEKLTPVKVIIYDPKGGLVSQSILEYKEINGILIPVKSSSQINTPMGKMDVELTYNNLKLNQGISDGEFKI